MTLPLLTRIGGLTIAFQRSACAGDVRDDHLTDAAILGVFLDDDESAGLAHRFFDRLAIPRHDRAQIDQFDARFVAQFVERFERFLDRVSPRDQGDIGARSVTRALPNDTARIGSARFVFGPKQMFRNQDKGRIFAMHRGPEQTGGVFRGARDGDVDPGIMGERSFVGLAVPQTAAGQIGAVGRVDHDRTGPRAEGTPAQVAEIRHELVPARPDEIDELQFEDRPFAVGGETARDAKDGRFRERRVENLLRKFGRKLLRETKDAALRIFDVFAENDAARIFVEAEPQRLVHDIADAVFSRRQDFVVQLRQLRRDFEFQFVRRRILRRVPLR